jgi:beta-galactosidase/beta-glucuronidase
LGYLVWGEYPSWGFDYGDPARIPDYCREWLESVRRDYNHPAIIGWIPMNENWGKQSNELVRAVYEATKMVDPGRPVIDVSWNFHVKTDFYDTHDYEQDNDVFAARYKKFEGGRIPDTLLLTQPLQYNRNMPFYLSEYGGLKWPADAFGWGYGQALTTEADFEERYCLFAKTLLENPDVCGLCYTQLYDVEQELNGIYYYSREAKFSEEMMDRMATIMTGKAAIEE